MVAWEFLCIAGIVFVILEVFTPALFFLNFAVAAFITSALSLYIHGRFTLVLIFFIFSFLSFAFLRPVIMKRKSKETDTGLESKYIGQTTSASEEISADRGVINIYGERWEARSLSGELIHAGSSVKIVKNESLIMYVEKI